MTPDEQRSSERDWFAVDSKGRVQGPNRPKRRRPPVLGVLGGVLVLTVGGIVVVNRTSVTDPLHPAPPSTVSSTRSAGPTASPSPMPTSRPSPSAAPTPGGGPLVTEVGHPLLGVTGTWNLFARGQGVAVRLEMARGRVTTTRVPVIGSTGSVAFVVGPDRMLIRPVDAVPGYVVPDGGPARAATGRLAQGGPVIPGPDQARVWVEAGTPDQPVMSLVTFDGTPAGASVPVPLDLSPLSPQTDGAGSLTFQGENGTYAVTSDGLHRVTTGELLGASAQSWLVSDCDDRHQCTTALVDRGTGVRRPLGPGLRDYPLPPGAMAPDGRFAAVPVSESDSVALTIIDLLTGLRREVPVMPQLDIGTIAWSPDSRWLLAVTALHTVVAVDAATGRVSSLGVTLPGVVQLAVRP